MTVLIVSQRIASIRHADKIIVLEDGEIAGSGRTRSSLRAVRFTGRHMIPSSRRRCRHEKRRTEGNPEAGAALYPPLSCPGGLLSSGAVVSVALTLYIPVLTGQVIDHIIGRGKVDFDAVFQ